MLHPEAPWERTLAKYYATQPFAPINVCRFFADVFIKTFWFDWLGFLFIENIEHYCCIKLFKKSVAGQK
jgi:hypothetical protein